MNTVRTRFAPSPTGYLHVGGLRTALYCYLFAKKHNGSFILRIEDTDQSRKVEGAMEKLIETLQWAGIEFDEGPGKDGAVGPYIQSQRLPLYKKYAEQLVTEEKAYYCFCTSERLEALRQKQTEAKESYTYDRCCLSIPKEEARTRVANGEQHVIRMNIPTGGEVSFDDVIRGTVTISNKILDDQVLLKSDGFPTYHLAVVVDDHLMHISHVIRGEEWLPSTPKHVLLYQYFGWEVPQFAHLPLLLNPDKSKLSKRQGDIAVEDYRAKGYLKEALINFIAFLGWNPGDEREIFSLEELKHEFTLERVGKSGAIFNVEKLQWLNQQHIRLKSGDELLAIVKPMAVEKGWTQCSDSYIKQVIGIMKERVSFYRDFVNECRYLFEDPKTFDENGRAKNWKPDSPAHLQKLVEKFSSLQEFSAAVVEQVLRVTAEELSIGAGKLIHPLRLAISGVSQGPSLFHLIEILGKEATLRRIQFALQTIPQS